MKTVKYLAYYENYLKLLADDLKLPITDANGDQLINITDYEKLLNVYFHGNIPENWKSYNCTKCKWCFNCKNCKWCTGCNGCVACTKCTGTVNGFGNMFDVSGAKSSMISQDIVIKPKQQKQNIIQKMLIPFMSLLC